MSNQTKEEKQEHIFNDIIRLQTIQSNLLTYLENNMTNGLLSVDRQNEIIDNITSITIMINDLYKTIDYSSINLVTPAE